MRVRKGMKSYPQTYIQRMAKIIKRLNYFYQKAYYLAVLIKTNYHLLKYFVIRDIFPKIIIDDHILEEPCIFFNKWRFFRFEAGLTSNGFAFVVVWHYECLWDLREFRVSRNDVSQPSLLNLLNLLLRIGGLVPKSIAISYPFESLGDNDSPDLA